jgi:hypothetical protein
MREKFQPFINFCAPRQFRLPGQSLRRAAGHRAGALFFARHQDYFVVTRNFTTIYLDLVPSRTSTVTRNLLPSTGTGKKQGTATQTAPNQTAGPLGFIASSCPGHTSTKNIMTHNLRPPSRTLKKLRNLTR